MVQVGYQQADARLACAARDGRVNPGRRQNIAQADKDTAPRRITAMSLSIRQGLLLFLMLASPMLASVVGLGLWGTWRSEQILKQVFVVEVAATQQLLLVDQQIARVRVRMYGVLNDDIGVDGARIYLAQARRDIGRAWQTYRTEIKREGAADEEEQTLIDTIAPAIEELPALLDRLDGFLANKDGPAINNLLKEDWWAVQLQVVTPIGKLIGLQEEHVAEAYAQSQDVYQKTLVGTSILLVVGLAMFLWFSRRVFTHVTEKLDVIEEALTRIGRGDFNTRVGGSHGGEFGRIVAALDQTVDTLRADRVAVDILRQRQASVLESMAEGLYGTDGEGRISYANSAAVRMLGWSIDEMLGKSPHQLFHHARADGTAYPVAECRLDHARLHQEFYRSADECFWRKDGGIIEVEVAAAPIIAAEHSVGGVVVFHDIGERRAGEAARQELLEELRLRNVQLGSIQGELSRQEEQLRSLLENLRDGVITIDTEGLIRSVNPAICTLFQQTEEALHEQNLTMLVPPEQRQAHRTGLARHVATGEAHLIGRTVEVEGLRADGSRFPIDLSINSYSVRGERFYSGIVRDISARKAAEAQLHTTIERLTELNRKLEEAQNQLLQSEKMASIGQLAAGVAHEINNPVGFVNSNLGSLRKEVKDLLGVIDAYALADPILADHPAVLGAITAARDAADLDYLRSDIGALIDESLEGLQRVRRIVQDLKDFSRVDSAEWQFANLEAGLDSTLNIVWNEIKYKAEVHKEYAGVPEVECIAAQVNQVLLNLLVNAAHAIEGRGTITLRTGFDANEAWVEVEDSGKGIAPEDLKRIFEPFFTTKPVGEGTGLGLSLAFSIAQRHRGRIEASSALGVGSKFRLRLPAKRLQANAPVPANAGGQGENSG
ncbi:MAG: PAS domain S-box protein [Candidatus Accumulibacter meliphilus]|jgi:PAS domain S-box-containing protein|uniref:histidine kinase n=1 Tax=Candidatus Accumulibacter meliphilus TaxID=2211374 RepID=A0A369XJH6_9PROT|nr:MAG: PAS domain S-box protein [Candidatus Accumulibacter meliphilus]